MGKRVNVELPADLHLRLRAKALVWGLTVAEAVNQAVDLWVDGDDLKGLVEGWTDD